MEYNKDISSPLGNAKSLANLVIEGSKKILKVKYLFLSSSNVNSAF